MTTRFPESAFAHIRDNAWLEAHGWFVAEGRHVTRRLLQSPGFDTAAILLTPVACDAMSDVVADRPDVFIQTQAQMDALTGFRLHQGCVSIGVRTPLPLWSATPSPPGVSVCLERVRDPDNVGSIVRSAAALGATRVLIGPDCADPFYRKAIRTSMGAVFSVPVVDASPWPDVIAGLRASGHLVVAMTPDPTAVPIGEALTGLGRDCIVLLVGSEGDGLSEAAQAAADVRARIPMVAGADSLNVGVATAVALYALSARSTLGLG